ncbi:hypothetical protein KY290_001643 [Solanum tuberosum]|uniref:Uncharacterized protein n=1 Tax=Solanum tuberosum TaxID=4113 RepID=A0ABQ7WNC1_SOLTU|nr:hypothetical protein KY284_001679 [Solanum tuberosum]KAH0782045.1 hypothetical protein KY290_001643 [Solanum tuberosum]
MRTSRAFDSDAPGDDMMEKRKVFEMALSTDDAIHYFDSDPTNLVQNLKKDGKKPSAYIADTTTANAQAKLTIGCMKKPTQH